MAVISARHSEFGAFSPFEDVDYDADEQTGADWYNLMLSASYGGKNIEGVSSAGSSEVLMKSDYSFAAKFATGTVKVNTRAKETPAVDVAGVVVAKNVKKYRGVTKANSFALVMEDTLWSSAAASRVRSGAYMAASMIAMGTELEKAKEVVEDIMGATMPDEVIYNVSVPMSILKRDTAVLAKARNALFVPQYLIQDVSWEDGKLLTSAFDANDALDWARVTTLAKYIGVANSLACPRFAAVAKHHGVPYALVNKHWAHVTPSPYMMLNHWEAATSNRDAIRSLVGNAAFNVKEAVSGAHVSVETLSRFLSDDTAGKLLLAMRSVRVKRDRTKLTIDEGNEVLLGVASHSINPLEVGILVKGAKTSNNALKSAMIAASEKTPGTSSMMATLLELNDDWMASDGDIKKLAKEIADRIVTREVFADATARLATEIADTNVATYRMAKLRRSLLKNSSALTDTVRVTSLAMYGLMGLVIGVSKAVVKGNRGMLLPPNILADPYASIQAGETLRLISSAVAYLDEAKTYWAARYQTRATSEKDKDKTLSVHYGMASSAMRKVKPEWLADPANMFLPADMLEKNYLTDAVEAYTRKRPGERAKIAAYPNESAISYATRMDDLLKPKTSFKSSVEFVTEKIRALADDFTNGVAVPNDPYVEDDPVEAVEPEAPEPDDDPFAKNAAMMAFFAEMDAAPAYVYVPTYEKMLETWKDNGDPEMAAKNAGYASFMAAFDTIGDQVAFDPEQAFTAAYMNMRSAGLDASGPAEDMEVI